MSRSLAALAVLVLLVSAAAPFGVGTAAAAEQVTLEVTVVDRTGGTVSDVKLSATWDGGGPVNETTRANGKALIDVPAGADVDISVHHDTYMRNFPYSVEDAAGESVQIDVAQKGQITVAVGSSEGPLTDAQVWLKRGARYPAAVQTDSNGQVTIGPVEQGDYELVVRKPGYLENDTRVTVGGESSRQMTLHRASVTASFTVVDDHFENPKAVENASVAIPAIGSSVTTLANGEVTTSVPVNRELQVEITKDGYETVTKTLKVAESDTEIQAAIQRTDAISVAPANERVVVGETTRVTVTDEYGAPVEGATVTAGSEQVGTTDADGHLTVTIDSAGDVTVEATSGDLSASATVEGFDPDATATPTGSTTGGTPTETTGEGGPGFTPLVTVLGVALAAGLLARRD
ncbi:carboxypeptidase regulatory-like domain-containing protein [Halobacteriales archaeon Cl-PHB]